MCVCLLVDAQQGERVLLILSTPLGAAVVGDSSMYVACMMRRGDMASEGTSPPSAAGESRRGRRQHITSGRSCLPHKRSSPCLGVARRSKASIPYPYFSTYIPDTDSGGKRIISIPASVLRHISVRWPLCLDPSTRDGLGSARRSDPKSSTSFRLRLYYYRHL